METELNEKALIPLVKSAIAGDHRRFIRLGIATIASIFGGRIVGEAVDSLMEQMWSNSQQAKQEAEYKRLQEEKAQTQLMSKVLRKELGTVLEDIRSKLGSIASAQDEQGNLLGEIIETLEAGQESNRQAMDDLNARIDRFLADIATEQPEQSEQEKALLHVVTTDLKVPHYANWADILFTVHNFGSRHYKIGDIQLFGIKRTQCDDVQLPREGQVSENFELSLDIRGRDETSFELLQDIGAQFTLAPDEAEAFRLKLYCDDGYIYQANLKSRLIDLEGGGELESNTVAINITYPITQIETLRARKTS